MALPPLLHWEGELWEHSWTVDSLLSADPLEFQPQTLPAPRFGLRWVTSVTSQLCWGSREATEASAPWSRAHVGPDLLPQTPGSGREGSLEQFQSLCSISGPMEGALHEPGAPLAWKNGNLRELGTNSELDLCTDDLGSIQVNAQDKGHHWGHLRLIICHISHDLRPASPEP